jgi:hypothetical protein
LREAEEICRPSMVTAENDGAATGLNSVVAANSPEELAAIIMRMKADADAMVLIVFICLCFVTF